jgi:anhydro-N-acetylmuramic acid kinase
MSTPLYIGMLSGTSMDGIDCALLDFTSPVPHVIDFVCSDLDVDLKRHLLTLCGNHHLDLRMLGNAHIAVALDFAATVRGLLARNRIRPQDIVAIGSHGQTIWHEPPQTAYGHPFSIQIGDPNTLAEQTGITVVADFRGRDMAAGGQGAPIVPALHRELFSSQATDRIILNLGGIANITFLPSNQSIPSGFDTGPASVLMDTWIEMQRGLPYDEGGSWAASGTPNLTFLTLLLDEPYFSQPAPKSTGRELFNRAWLQQKIDKAEPGLQPEDVQATLLVFTVATISTQIEKLTRTGEVLVCGGGARNLKLMEVLASRLPAFKVMTTSDVGLHADMVEAAAFGWLAKLALARTAVDLTPFTGARHPVLAGGIYFAPTGHMQS